VRSSTVPAASGSRRTPASSSPRFEGRPPGGERTAARASEGQIASSRARGNGAEANRRGRDGRRAPRDLEAAEGRARSNRRRRSRRSTSSPPSGSSRGAASSRRGRSRTTSSRPPIISCRSSPSIGSPRSGRGRSTATHGGEGARHRDPRMTLRVYTDVTNMRPRTRLGGLLSESEWAPLGTNPDKGQIRHNGPTLANRRRSPKPACLQRFRRTGATGLEPAASGVTGRRSNQLSYAPEGARRRGRRRYAG
jgi:hypothetical protein